MRIVTAISKTRFLVGLLAVAVATQLVSCATAAVQASAAEANDKEGGPSSDNHNGEYGLGLGVNWIKGLNGEKGNSSSRREEGAFFTEDSAWRSVDRAYALPAQPMEGFALGGTFEFIQKGSKDQGTKVRENYLELQGDALYYHKLTNGDGIYGGLGPFIAYGIGGKASGNGFDASTFGSEGYKRFDAGLNVQAGYQMSSGFRFSLGYDLGLVDKSTDPSDYTSHTRAFALSVGYSVDKIIAAIKHN